MVILNVFRDSERGAVVVGRWVKNGNFSGT